MIHNDSFVCYVISVQASFGCSQFQSSLRNYSFVCYLISVLVEST